MSSRSLSISRSAAIAVLLAVVGFGVALARPHPAPTPTPTPSPTPVADPAITKLMRQQFVAFQAGSINKDLYSPQLRPKLTDAMVTDLSRKLAVLGPLDNMVYLGRFYTNDIPSDAHGYIYQMLCNEGNVYLLTIIDGQGKIATIYFKDKLTTEDVEVPGGSTPAPEASP